MFRQKLTSIASKLLNSEHSKLEDLSVEEQNLWRSFDNSDIYEFITGEPDTLPEFQNNWIEPCQLAVHFPPAPNNNYQCPPDAIPPPVHIAAPQGLVAPPPVPQRPNQNPPAPQVVQQLLPSGLQAPPHQHDLRPRPDLNYKKLHTRIKQRYRKLRRQAKAVVTQLAPGAFSPKNSPPGQPSQNKVDPKPSS